MDSHEPGNLDSTIKEKTNSLKDSLKAKAYNNGAQIYECYEKEKKNYQKIFMNKKLISASLIVFFLLLLVGSVVVFCFITFTNKFNEGIVEKLVLKNDTITMTWWKDSPIQPLVKVHIFNYTNIDEYMANPKNKKLKVDDVGPFVFREYGQKVNLQHHDDYTITFQDNKTLEFVPDQSVGDLDETKVNVPNVPLLVALQMVKKMDSIDNFKFNLALTSTNPKDFQEKSINEILFGYQDAFTKLVEVEKKKVGLLSAKNGVSTDNMTIYTAEDDLDNLGRIKAMNGAEALSIWNTDECNEITGTDGTQFPPQLMDATQDLKIFIRSFCRSLHLNYDREVLVLNGIPAWRYKTPLWEFNSSRTVPEMKCFCDHETENCLPDGCFDATKCNNGTPILISYPHFMEGDASLLEHFEGLHPDRSKHETFADIHPRMAFPIGGASRIQINLKIDQRSYAIFNSKTTYRNLPKDLILPICWFEVTAGEIPPEFLSVVFHTTHSANATFIAIQYGSLICALVSLLLLLLTMHCFFKNEDEEVQNRSGIENATVSYSNVYPQLSNDIHS